MRSADVPLLTLAVRAQHERTLAGANQYPYAAHPGLLSSGGQRDGSPDPARACSNLTWPLPVSTGLPQPSDDPDGGRAANSSPSPEKFVPGRTGRDHGLVEHLGPAELQA